MIQIPSLLTIADQIDVRWLNILTSRRSDCLGLHCCNTLTLDFKKANSALLFTAVGTWKDANRFTKELLQRFLMTPYTCA